MRLIIVRGCPGSGKSTFCQKTFPHLFHIENDMFHYVNGEYKFKRENIPKAILWCNAMCRTALESGMDVVVSNTFTRADFIDGYKTLANMYGAKFTVYRMCGQFDNVHDVPKYVLESMKNGFEDYEGEIFVTPTEDGEYTVSPTK